MVYRSVFKLALAFFNLNSNSSSLHCRCTPKWPDRALLRVSHVAACRARGQDRARAQTSEGRAGHSDVVVRARHVHARPLQHLPPPLPRHVHLRHLRDEFLHDGEAARNAGRGLQLPDVRAVHDPPLPNVHLCWLGRGAQWNHGWEGLWARWV